MTHSSGNHAQVRKRLIEQAESFRGIHPRKLSRRAMQALAFAAKEQGIKAHIVMPLGAPSVKVNAVKGYGAQVSLYLQKGGMGAQLV